MARACDFYHVSADFLLGRTSSRDGSIIEAAELYDASDEKGTLKGSILATLQKKLVVNTTGMLFDLLGKCGRPGGHHRRRRLSSATALYHPAAAPVPAGRRQRGLSSPPDPRGL